MGFQRSSGKRKGLRAFSSGVASPSLQGVGRTLVPRPMTATQISQLNASVLSEIAQAPMQTTTAAQSFTYDDGFFDDAEPDYDNSNRDLLEVLDGNARMDISGAGGEFEHLRDDATTTPAQRYANIPRFVAYSITGANCH